MKRLLKGAHCAIYILFCCVKFILGYALWISIFLFSIIFNTVTWNWKETYTMNFEIIIKEICGESTWKCMLLED